MTREETVSVMRTAGFREIEMRRPPDLGPLGDRDGVVVFLGRRPEAV
jgi:hypothetical protein